MNENMHYILKYINVEKQFVILIVLNLVRYYGVFKMDHSDTSRKIENVYETI